MSGGRAGISGQWGMLASGGHSGVTEVIEAGVASWQEPFKVVSGGHAGAGGAWWETGAEMPVESPADRHGQWMPHLARMNKRHWTVGDTVDSGEQWGEALSRCRQWGIHEARSKNGGHRSKVASGVTLRHKRWVTGTWVVRRAHSGRQRRTQQAGMVSEATLRAVSGAMVRQADNRDHAGTGMLSLQWHSQSVGHRDWRVRGTTLRQGGHWGHPGPNIQGTHTLTGREVSEGHTGTGVVSGSHTGSGISRVTRGLFSRWAAVPEAAPLTVSLAAQRRESVVKEMQPESARPKPLSTRW